MSLEKGRRTIGRGFKPPVDGLPVVISSIKMLYGDRLVKECSIVEESRKSNVPSPEKKVGLWLLRATFMRKSHTRRVGAHVSLKNSGKNPKIPRKLCSRRLCKKF